MRRRWPCHGRAFGILGRRRDCHIVNTSITQLVYPDRFLGGWRRWQCIFVCPDVPLMQNEVREYGDVVID